MLSKRILVIGDNQANFQPIKKFVQSNSTDVSYAMSVKEALNYLLTNEYCLAIIYISLSINDSTVFLRLVRETHLMPIIVIASKLGVSEKVALFHAGANACLEEPVDATLCAAQACSLIQLYWDAKIADNNEHPLVFGTELIINHRHVIIKRTWQSCPACPVSSSHVFFLLFFRQHPGLSVLFKPLYYQTPCKVINDGKHRNAHKDAGESKKSLKQRNGKQHPESCQAHAVCQKGRAQDISVKLLQYDNKYNKYHAVYRAGNQNQKG